MPLPLFKKIIDDAATIPQITEVAFAGLADPLMDPHLEERIAYTKQARPFWRTEMYTNGVRLTPEKFEKLRAAGLDIIVISLNAASAEQHEKIMGLKGKFGKVCENADYARRNTKGKVDVLIKAVRDDVNFTMEDQVRFYLTWGMRLRPDLMPGHGQVVWMCNWAGSVPTVEGREIEPDSCCGRALTQLSILWDGKVTMCCYDPLNTFPLGDGWNK